MMIVAIRKYGTALSVPHPCTAECPFYTETGKVRGIDNLPIPTHCLMTMHPWMADCDIYNPCQIDTLEVTEEQWITMQQAVNKQAKRQRKLYPEEHAEIHAPGCEWTRSKGRFNAVKSNKISNAKIDTK